MAKTEAKTDLDDVFEGPRYTKTDTDKARASAELAKRRLLERDIANRLRPVLDTTYEVIAEVDNDDLVAIATAKVKTEAESEAEAMALGTELSKQAEDPDFIAAALETLAMLREDADRRKRYAQVLTEDAQRRYDMAERALWPACVEYARINDANRSTAKAWKLPGTEARLQLVSKKDRLEVTNPKELIEFVKGKIGTMKAIEENVIKVTETVSAPSLVKSLTDRGISIAHVPGAVHHKACEELTLYRR